jgi:hypothetical protein
MSNWRVSRLVVSDECNMLMYERVQLSQKTRSLNEEPDQTMLARLRVLEKKMGLVLTLVRALLCIISRPPASPICNYIARSSKLQYGELSTTSLRPTRITTQRTTRPSSTDRATFISTLEDARRVLHPLLDILIHSHTKPHLYQHPIPAILCVPSLPH